jgi:ABC-type phosphate transport system substrate-binding protein
MRRTAISLFLIGFLAVSVSAFAQNRGFKVVGHPSTTPDSITKKDLARIFLKQKTKWPSGQAAEPVDLKGSQELRSRFYEQVLNKTLDMIESHWQAQVFSGKGRPPTTASSESAVVALVRSRPGAVGFVSAGAATDGVKLIRVTD